MPDADLILDGTDNFEIRYLINDVAVKTEQAVGLRRLYRQPRPDHDDSAGPDALSALRLRGSPRARRGGHLRDGGRARPHRQHHRQLAGDRGDQDPHRQPRAGQSRADYIDIWDNIHRRIKVAPLLGKVDCPCCQRRRFEWLDGEHGSQTTSLCGRNAVQVSHRTPGRLNFEEMAQRSGNDGRGELQPLPAEVQRGRATSSPCSPMAGRSSRGPAISSGHGRCMPGMLGIEEAFRWQPRPFAPLKP